MNSYRITFRSACCYNSFFASPFCLLLNFLDQLFGNIQCDFSLSDSHKNLLNQGFICFHAGNLLLDFCRCIILCLRIALHGIIFNFFRNTVIISCKHIEVICKTIHISFCSYITSKLDTDSRKTSLCTTCYCTCNINFR